MNLLAEYKNITYITITLKEFEEYLKKSHDVGITTNCGTLQIYHDNAIFTVSCVENYYQPLNKMTQSKTKRNPGCYNTRKTLGIENPSNMECIKCHLDCFNKYRNNELKLNVKGLLKELWKY